VAAFAKQDSTKIRSAPPPKKTGHAHGPQGGMREMGLLGPTKVMIAEAPMKEAGHTHGMR